MENDNLKNESNNANLLLGVVICDTCKNSENGIKCLVKHKFKEDGKTQSEFIKILGGVIQRCDYYA